MNLHSFRLWRSGWTSYDFSRKWVIVGPGDSFLEARSNVSSRTCRWGFPSQKSSGSSRGVCKLEMGIANLTQACPGDTANSLSSCLGFPHPAWLVLSFSSHFSLLSFRCISCSATAWEVAKRQCYKVEYRYIIEEALFCFYLNLLNCLKLYSKEGRIKVAFYTCSPEFQVSQILLFF